MSVKEKWCIYTEDETHFCFEIHQVSRLENQLREERKAYRTIYYRNNEPVRYEIGHGYTTMTKKEERAIVDSVRASEGVDYEAAKRK